MSKSSRTLNITKDGTNYTCDLYSTTAEARENYIPVNADGTNLYAALLPVSDANAGTYGTPFRVQKNGDATQYCVAQKAMYKITIVPVANETITVKAGGQTWTSGEKWLPYGTTWTATIAAANGYNPGTITGGATGTLTNSDVSISATAATLAKFTLTLAATTNQTITLEYTEPGANKVTKTSKSSAQNFSVTNGTTWKATIAGDTGYTPGTLSAKSGTVTAATTVSATAAKLKTYTLKLAATTNQTITLKYTRPGATAVTKTSKSTAQTFTVEYGTKWTASLAAGTGYTKGSLSASSGTVTAATTVSATAAAPNITFTASGDYTDYSVTYKNASGTNKTASKPSSVTIKSGTTITIKNNKTDTYYYTYNLKITQASTYKTTISGGGTWTSGSLSAPVTFKLVSSREYDDNVGSQGEGSGGEGMGGGGE